MNAHKMLVYLKGSWLGGGDCASALGTMV